MEQNRKYMGAAALTLVLAAVLLWYLQKVAEAPAVRFSHGEAFQEQAFDLTLDGGLLGGPFIIRWTAVSPHCSRPSTKARFI